MREHIAEMKRKEWKEPRFQAGWAAAIVEFESRLTGECWGGLFAGVLIGLIAGLVFAAILVS